MGDVDCSVKSVVSVSALVSQLYSIKSGNIQSLVLVDLFFFFGLCSPCIM